MDFLFHNLTEKEKQEIKTQVNSILDSFSKKLSELKKDIGESHVEREESERLEGRKKEEMSREIFFDNAHDKTKDFIVAERKKW